MNDDQFENEQKEEKINEDVKDSKTDKTESEESKEENSQENKEQEQKENTENTPEEDEEAKKKSQDFQREFRERLNAERNKKNNDNKKVVGRGVKVNFNFKGFAMLIFIVSLIFFFSNPTFFGEEKRQNQATITYTAFINNIENKVIKSVEENDGYVYGYVKDSTTEKVNKNSFLKNLIDKKEREINPKNNSAVEPKVFKTRLVTNRLGEDENLMTVLKNNDVPIEATEPEQPSLFLGLILQSVPLLLMVGLLVLFITKMTKGGGGGKIFNMGKSKTKENGENISNVTFDDVAGIDEAKQELKEVVDFLKEPEKFKKIGAKIPKGVLLLGEPGTGKTLLAKAVAGEAKVPFFSMSGSEFVEMFVGVGASRVRDLFNKARKNAPCIVFIDEIDAVGRKRGTGQGGGNDEREQTLNQLLVEMDGFGTEETIIVLAATNRADVLDRALKRPGRFDRQVMVDMPDVKGREEILKVHAKNKKFVADVDFKIIAKKTAGMAGADLANILNEGAIIAARANRAEISMADLEEASEKVQMGPEKRSKVVPEAEKRVVAYHESGHAIVNYVLGGETKVHKITMIPRGRAGGYTLSLPAEEKILYSKKYFMDEITIFFGGRAAEELIFGKDYITNGASNDIERATSYAQYMVTRVGMSDKFGPVLLDGTQDGDMFQRKYYSEQTGKEVDDEIRSIINERYQKALSILKDNRNKLETLTTRLLEKETIMGDEFEEIMRDESI